MKDGYYWVRENAQRPWYLALCVDGEWMDATWEPRRDADKPADVGHQIPEPE